ncbi:endonuclease/exonuclease/phosphatase family protein [Paenarthrobacter sp. YJN-5]|uniref:endonuclease/exonuclease/phosphatase family protein n=1 Tax=Paenarthrobacter sp. YJN-5 TaxID=2735316 RepID=UPI00187856AB|nr:endonuclease/exonuclease/phosphatase family protein [Paenarthrobacter sp. YJN-5]QOT19265.1 endonuclease/exonuclease/phosphatase family protein [Paenarthrobacter sp. YJN-5]
MRIVSWNCSMALYKKRHLLDELAPDVAVLQEVSKKDIEGGNYPFAAWVGSNPHKGLGVIGFSPGSYRMTEPGDRGLPWHLPFSVDGLNVVALWAHQLDKDLKYVRVTHKIVDQHARFLGTGRAMIVGDFNSNTVWDHQHRGRNHSMLVDKLRGIGLDSVYHRQHQSAHGAEQAKTFFHNWDRDLGHHIDYAFVSSGVEAKVTVGEIEHWLPYSDHMPLVIDLD